MRVLWDPQEKPGRHTSERLFFTVPMGAIFGFLYFFTLILLVGSRDKIFAGQTGRRLADRVKGTVHRVC